MLANGQHFNGHVHTKSVSFPSYSGGTTYMYFVNVTSILNIRYRFNVNLICLVYTCYT